METGWTKSESPVKNISNIMENKYQCDGKKNYESNL